jgi:hypothetical protein
MAVDNTIHSHALRSMKTSNSDKNRGLVTVICSAEILSHPCRGSATGWCTPGPPQEKLRMCRQCRHKRAEKTPAWAE